MLQAFYLDVTKVDLDIAYTCMLQAYVFKCFKVFHMYVCKCFIWMLHMFAMVFKCFFRHFRRKCFRRLFLVFHLFFVTVASGCFKSRSGIARDARGKRMAVQATFWTTWATFGAARAHCLCACSPDTLGARCVRV